jgi:FixJ family two-component response regulator
MARSARRAKGLSAAAELLANGPSTSEPMECAGTIHILVIDDDELTCHVIQEALAHSQFRIHTVSDPLRVEAAIREHVDVKLVVLDYMQPGLEHAQVLAWLQECHPQAAVIVITGYPSVEGVQSALRAGAYDFITKPFELAQLRRTVMKCLESRGYLRMKTAALREAVGAVIRERRQVLDLTLCDLAEKSGISLGYLSQVELGKNSPSIDTLYRVSVALGIPLSELFSEKRS